MRFPAGAVAPAMKMATGLVLAEAARAHVRAADHFVERRKMKAQFRYSKGFSLVELLVVIAILGLLAAIAIPMYGDYRIRSNRTEGKAALSMAACW